MARLGKVEISDRAVAILSDAELVRRLVASGMSRLTAERVVAIERGNAEPGRARRHHLSR
ncbi:MAG: hypothetical protein M3123_04600 [Actinomycetota bacterium]|nr:hypothetical protein [Actinomycetota bacterium]